MDNLPILVLETLFHLLDFEDLIRIRIVSRRFCSLTTRFLESKLGWVSLRTAKHFSDFISIHRNSCDPLHFKKFILNPNAATEAEIEEFSNLYGSFMTEVCVNIAPPGCFKPKRVNRKPVCYDENCLSRIHTLLQHGNNIEILIIEDDYAIVQVQTQGISVPTLPNLFILDVAAKTKRFKPWILGIINNASNLKYTRLQVTDYDEIELSELKSRGLKDLYPRRDLMASEEEAKEYNNIQGRIRQGIIMLHKLKNWSEIGPVHPYHARNAEKVIMHMNCYWASVDGMITDLYFPVFPKVTVLRLSVTLEDCRFFNASNFPALRRVYTHEVPYYQASLKVFKGKTFESVEKLRITVINIIYDDLKTSICPWDTVFPNLRHFEILSHSYEYMEPHLTFLLPKFKKLQTLCLTNDSGPGNCNMGVPKELLFSGLQSLKYRGWIGKKNVLLQELVNSSALGYLSNVSRISIQPDITYGSVYGNREMVQAYLEKLNLRHSVVELLESYYDSDTETKTYRQIYPSQLEEKTS